MKLRDIVTLRFWLRVDRNMNKEVFLGDREETMSSRMGRRLVKDKKGFLNWRYHFCRLLSFIERNMTNKKGPIRHCVDSIKTDD